MKYKIKFWYGIERSSTEHLLGGYWMKLLPIVWFLFLTFPFGKVIAQQPGLHEWLREQNVTRMDISVNWDSLIVFKNSDRDWTASVTFITHSGDSVELKAKVAVRGKYRRRICDIPPIEIDFKKKSLRKKGFDDSVDNYKLVTHCDDSYRRLQLVETESAIYQMYQVLTPFSFKSVEMDVQYFSPEGGKITAGRAILLESPHELAKRNDLSRHDGFGRKDSIDNIHLTRLALFQCLISNHDWDIDMLKNIKLFKSRSGDIIPVPYDFDFSGWLRAPYWTPRSDLKLLEPSDRYLFLDAVENSILEEQWALLRTMDPEFRNIIDTNPSLKRSTRKWVFKQMDDFFELYKRIKKGERRFVTNY